MTDTVTNLISTYLSATPDEHAEGMWWYPRVHNDIALMQIDPWVGAGVYAAYSINTDWDRNQELAIETLIHGYPRTDSLGLSVQFAQRILNGEHPLEVFSARARKARAFTAAIAEPTNSTTAVIDRHARNAAYGRIVPAKKKIGKAEYAAIADAYSEAADMAGLHVNEMQAIVWLAWRRKIGAK